MRASGRMLSVRICVCLSLLGFVFASPAASQGNGDDEARKEAAASMYKLAVQQFKAGKYKEALDKMLEVQELDPNPVILYNIARCYEELGKLANAAEYFQRASADEGLPSELLAEIGKRLPKVLPALKVKEANTLAFKAVGLGTTQGGERALEAYVAKQKSGDIIINNNTINNNEGLDQGLMWGGAGAGVIGLGLLSVAAIVDAGLSDPIEELKDPQTRTDRARTLDLQEQISGDQTTATILYITGGVLLAAGGAMLALSLTSGGEAPPEASGDPKPEAEGAWRVVPFVGDGSAGIWLGGRFE